MTLKTVPASIAALLAASVLLAGCNDDSSGDADGEKSGDPTTSASTGASDGASAGTSDDASEDGGSSGDGSGELTTDNFFDEVLEAQQAAGSFKGRATTTTAGTSMTIETEATYEDGKALSHGRTTADSPQKLETISASGVVYIQAAGLGVPAGKWLKIDSNDPANKDNPFAALAAISDPETALRAMGDLDSLKLVGAEKVDGVDADHYKAVMNTKSYADVLGLPADAASTLPKTIPFDIWIDDENRPVKYDVSLSTQGVTTSTSQTYYDYGSDVDITVPKDGDTVSLSETGLG
ncbi:MAG TPA: hypothetical protein VM575_11885 [Nocardioides sp.]|nr:hypothetical protein [Nocardioides sp.]